MNRKLLVLLLGLVPFPVGAAPGTLIKDEDLRSSPSATAAKVASVAKGSSVDVLARDGGWTQIRVGGRTGWVRILSVRSSVGATGAGDLAALTSRREGQVVAVAGLRGLSEEELKSARFNAQELVLMDRYKVDQTEATGFARAAGLTARQVAYLPDPKPTSSSRGTGNNVWEFGQ